ncbi:uncharacterized protein [Epargyreus clarus]|uniref:uncharacterized protein n=1 Tax=Epargyreus clarus TaxID=520877 RepID=UPI003C2F7550
MHMWMWFGYDLGEFLFAGLTVNTRWAFALTWIVLFFVAVLFEASKVYLARVQREAIRKLYPYRSDERRTLLCDREQGGAMEPTTSRNTGAGQVSRWTSFKIKALVNAHQSLVFVAHNTVGYLLMLAVMLYNAQLLLAVVLGMMLGYFLFGTKLTRLQMQCFSTKRVVICTPECDDTAENTTPPLLESPPSSESDFFICQTRTCIQPSHYFPASTSRDGASDQANATCYYGAKSCPARVARAKKAQAATRCHHAEPDKDDSPAVEDAQLLRTERQGCCKKPQEPPPEEECCQAGAGRQREDSPQITCCHNAKSTPTDSQEQIIKDL